MLPPLKRYFRILLNPEIKLTTEHHADRNALAFSRAGTIQFKGRCYTASFAWMKMRTKIMKNK